ncbi:hypothetical protein TcWFU_009527 [Taenia crassiceps]|uniref:Uncharacterized protein n=1 Tax=Taenia crassiceps TaxID=6207 RepID=A0ABR4Q7D4_9CEST
MEGEGRGGGSGRVGSGVTNRTNCGTNKHECQALMTSPRLASPRLASPRLALPHITSPHLTSPHLTSPHLTSCHVMSLHVTTTDFVPPPNTTLKGSLQCYVDDCCQVCSVVQLELGHLPRIGGKSGLPIG